MEKLEQALQLLLKLSNKPLFMYVDELKEIAKLIHEVGNSEANPTLLTEDKEGEGQGDAVEFAEWIQKEVEKENIMRSVIVGKYLIFENDDVIIRKTTQELYEQFKITRL